MFRTIFWALIFILALSFFGISLRAIIMSPAGQENFGYVWHLLVDAWQWFVAWLVGIILVFKV